MFFSKMCDIVGFLEFSILATNNAIDLFDRNLFSY